MPSESAAQLTPTKSSSRRGLAAWMLRAISSLPVPVSPFDQHGRRHARDLFDQRQRLADRGAVADDRVLPRALDGLPEIGVLHLQPLVRLAELLDQAGVLAGEMEHLDRPPQRDPKLVVLPGLGDVAVDAAAVDRLDERADVGVAGEHDAHRVRTDLHRARQELRAAHARHALVGDDHRGVGAIEQLERRRAAVGRHDLELVAVVEPEELQDVGLVVDDDDRVAAIVEVHAPPICSRARLCCQVRAPGSASTMVKVAPRPGSLSTSMRPPCAAMMPWLIDRPRPVPAPTSLVVKNGSKMRACRRRRGMPRPSSRMATAYHVAVGARGDGQTCPSLRVASQALARTFTKTWLICPGSQSTGGSSP